MSRMERPNGGPLAEDDTRPLHVRIRALIEARVIGGDYPLGSLMPTEIELAREFETSRFTIREALRWLHERGYVERRQGVGTRVVSQRPKANFSFSVGSLEELFLVATDTYFVINSDERITLDGPLAELVGGSEGEVWIRLDAMRWNEPGGRPLCHVEVFIPDRFAALLPEIRTLKGPIFALLERYADGPIQKTVQEISAMEMPSRIARMVCQRPDAWALRLVRRYVTREGVLITSVNWHPADQMTYVMEIDRAAPLG